MDGKKLCVDVEWPGGAWALVPARVSVPSLASHPRAHQSQGFSLKILWKMGRTARTRPHSTTTTLLYPSTGPGLAGDQNTQWAQVSTREGGRQRVNWIFKITSVKYSLLRFPFNILYCHLVIVCTHRHAYNTKWWDVAFGMGFNRCITHRGKRHQLSCSDHPSQVPIKSLYHAIKHSPCTIWTAGKLILECFKHSTL